MPSPPRLLIAGAVLDPAGGLHRPGAVWVRDGQAEAWGPADELEKAHGHDAAVTRWPDRLLTPGFVNAHAHLELTHVGPQPYPGDFIAWVTMLREHWPGEGEAFAKVPDLAWLADAARVGARQSLAAGVEFVGDIQRGPAVTAAVRDEGLGGVGFLELFGLGPPLDADALQQIATDQDAEGWQPHAPYSAGRAVFEAAAASGKPVSTHLAEMLEEHAMVADAAGPFRDFIAARGKWEDGFTQPGRYGEGLTPVRWMEPALRTTPWIVAHCNYVTDDDLALLAETGASVAYCPVASDYFGHPTQDHPGFHEKHFGGGHRYREMLDAGVNVCLGTDSVVCQPADEAQPLGILPQMRFLYRRDATEPALLFRMALQNGRAALRHDGSATLLASMRFDPGDPRDPRVQVLGSDALCGSVLLQCSKAWRRVESAG